MPALCVTLIKCASCNVRAAIRLKARVVGEGHGDVGGFADLHCAREAWRGDADDRRWDFVHLNRFADDSRIAAETVLPVAVRDDGYRLGSRLVVLLRERTTENRRHAQAGVAPETS